VQVIDGSPWAALLAELDSVAPQIGVWKNADDALRGRGDVDYSAPRECWPEIHAVFRIWADTYGFESVPPCLHRPGAMYLVALDRSNGRLMQLDVRERLTSGGSDVIDAKRLGGLLVYEGRPFKTLPTGAEAALKLLLTCIDRRGRIREDCWADESVATGIATDFPGALGATSRIRNGRRAASRLVESIRSGSPDHGAARAFRRDSRLAALREPGRFPEHALYRVQRRQCPLLRWVLSHGQQLPPDPDGWIGEARRAHGNTEAWLNLEAERENESTAPGRFLVIAGPDGVGKTTLREALTQRLSPELAIWSGRLSGPLSELRRARQPSSSDTGSVARGKSLATFRLLYLFIDALLRWLFWTRSWVKTGGWVITERGWWDLAVYPARYRLPRMGLMHKVLGAMSPRPDLILVLEGDPETIRSRKQELSPDEVARQTMEWRSVVPAKQPVVFLDADQPPRILVELTLQALEEQMGESLTARPSSPS
jgi:thymidylate kinase